jgi:hypothetical protein
MAHDLFGFARLKIIDSIQNGDLHSFISCEPAHETVQPLPMNIVGLRNSEINNSLVCTFPAKSTNGVAKPNLITKMEHRKLHRSILNGMQPGNRISVAAATKLVGGHSNTTYKDRIAQALPLDELCNVLDNSGQVIGVLRRTKEQTKSDNTYGDIVCERRLEITEGNNVVLFPDGLTH